MGGQARRRIRKLRNWGVAVGLVLLRLWLRPVGPGPDDAGAIETLGPALPEGWQRWGVVQDWLLVGPDAGAWAEAAVARLQGAPLDPNRLPVYPTLTAWAAGQPGDVVFAGHAVNHLASATVPALIWALGLAMGAPSAGLVAGVLVALNPALMTAAGLYGADPAFQMMVVLTALLAWLSLQKGTALAPVLGLVGGLTLATHFLGFAILAPLLALGLLSRRGPWHRWLSPVVTAAIAIGIFRLLFHNPTLSSDLAFIQGIYGTGVTGLLATPQSQVGVFEAAVLAVSEGLGPALQQATDRILRSLRFAGLPPVVLAALLGIGILAPNRRRGRWDFRAPALLTLVLAPALLLEAAQGPERYSRYALPFGFLALGRAVGLLAAPLEFLGRMLLRRWPSGTARLLLALVFLALFLPTLLRQRPRPERPVRPAQDVWVARQLGETFPSAGGLLTRSQNLAFLAALPRCPDRPCEARLESELGECLHAVLDGCPGSGDLPFVREITLVSGPGDVRSQLFESFVLAGSPMVFSHVTTERRVEVYRLSRERLRAAAGPRPQYAPMAPGQRPDGRPLPGPNFMGPGAALPPIGPPR